MMPVEQSDAQVPDGLGDDADDVRIRWAEALLVPLGRNKEKKMAVTPWVSLAATVGRIPVMRRAIDRWEKLDQRRWRQRKAPVIIGVILLFLLLLFFPDGGVLRYYGVFVPNSYGLLDLTSSDLEKREFVFYRERTDVRTPEQKRLLGEGRRWSTQDARNLWRSDPGNPAFYAEYIISLHQTLPSDFDETVKRIDPDNSWFDYVAAHMEAGYGLREDYSSPRDSIVRGWLIDDPVSFGRAVERIKAARGKTRYDSYADSMNRLRIPQIPQKGYEDLWSARDHLRADFGMYSVAKVMAAHARRLADSGDVAGFREWRDDGLAFLRLRMESPNFSPDSEWDLRICYRTLIPELNHSAGILGIQAESPDVLRWNQMIERDWTSYIGKPTGPDVERMEKLLETHGRVDFIGHHFRLISLGRLERVPREIHSDELKPGRMDDFARYSAKLCWVAFLSTSAASFVVWVFRGRVVREARLLGARLVSVLGLADWVWIIAGGVLLPFVALAFVFWETPFGGTDLGLRVWLFNRPILVPAGIHAAALLTMLILPVLIGRWRLATRVEGLEFSRWRGLGWLVVGMTFLSAFFFTPPWARWYGLIGLDVGLLWLLVMGGRAFVRAGRHPVPVFAMSRVILPAFLCGALVWLLAFRVAIPLVQDHWFAQDRFLRLTPEAPASTPYNYLVARQMRDELRQMLRDDSGN